MTYRECFEWGKQILKDAGIEEASLDARLCLEYVCDTGYHDLLAHGDRPVSAECEKSYEEMIGKRKKHIPLQYLTGRQNFMGLDFSVEEGVLIPRQDTEILVEEVLRELSDGMRILDLCTGSGCILISLLHYSNDCSGVGTDLSAAALAVARKNAANLLKEEVDATFLQGDLFADAEGVFDRIISNPPYIRTDQIKTLMPEVGEHEPLSALDGGEDGLSFYRRIVGESRKHLAREGRLYLEIGCDQAEEVCRLLEANGYSEIRVVQDYAGLNRVVCGVLL